MNHPSSDDTVEFKVRPEPELPARSSPSRVQTYIAALSHRGKVRPNNEDHFLCVRFGRFLETLFTNLPPDSVPTRFEELGHGLLVADGMGGHAGGEVASKLAIQTLLDLVLSTPDWILSDAQPEAEQVMQRMAERYRQIDAVLTEQGRADPNLRGMGTTLTMACNFGASLVLAHVGDSRAYLLRGDALHQLTRDHTMAQALADMGIVRQEDVASHRLRHSLTRVLGARGDACEAEVLRLTLTDADLLLLCSDGLTEMVEDATIAEVLARAPSVQEACQSLIDSALKAGGKDNVTVVLARYRFLPEEGTP